VNEKLIRRHPHVFGEQRLVPPTPCCHQWDAIKEAEKKNGPPPEGVFKRLPPALSALLGAREIFKQIGKKTFARGGGGG